MVDESGQELKDYKIFCFQGTPRYIQLDYGRFTNHGRNYYDTSWKFLSFMTKTFPFDQNRFVTPPPQLSCILALAAQLSQDIPFARVDFYSVKGKIYFGEMTFYPGSGFEEFTPAQWDKTFGDWLILPQKYDC